MEPQQFRRQGEHEGYAVARFVAVTFGAVFVFGLGFDPERNPENSGQMGFVIPLGIDDYGAFTKELGRVRREGSPLLSQRQSRAYAFLNLFDEGDGHSKRLEELVRPLGDYKMIFMDFVLISADNIRLPPGTLELLPEVPKLENLRRFNPVTQEFELLVPA
ncbi:hypothetical protein HYX70_01265 [Candidatus Saccharibacteria bacterium]|nr:hypothetical protein [Candidatus Saccharibacteria bacterium]